MIKCLLTFTSVLGMACIVAYTYFIWCCILKMEKLVKLLNEYHFSWTEYVWYYLDEKENRIYFRTKVIDKWLIDEQRISDERIISKKFWFIKWLVDNGKIDMRKAKYYSDSIYYQDYWEWDWACKDYEFVIMLLAISDTPIDDLISYLK